MTAMTPVFVVWAAALAALTTTALIVQYGPIGRDRINLDDLPDDVALCINGCRRPAIAERPIGMEHDDLVFELVCDHCMART